MAWFSSWFVGNCKKCCCCSMCVQGVFYPERPSFSNWCCWLLPHNNRNNRSQINLIRSFKSVIAPLKHIVVMPPLLRKMLLSDHFNPAQKVLFTHCTAHCAKWIIHFKRKMPLIWWIIFLFSYEAGLFCRLCPVCL